MRSFVALALVTLCLPGAAPCAWAADIKPRVSFEVLTLPGLAPTASRKWYEMLTGAGVSGLQIRAAGSRDKPGVTKQGTRAVPSYRVVGILSSNNVLHLPGGRFKLSDGAGLSRWLDKLRDGGSEGVTRRRSAFGLLPSQLQEVTTDLKRSVAFSTKGTTAASSAGQLADMLRFRLIVDASSRRALADVVVEEELRGLSAGTALAVILRPAGLVLVPEHPSGGTLQYRVKRASREAPSWPVGWKPSERPVKVLPKLYEFLTVEITGIPVSEAMQAIGGRIDAPLLYDRNAMALHGVDPAHAPAELPSKRISYSQTLRRVLSQAKLKYELRVDEAEKPFLWITTIKPAR